jgi:hypothetical protein
LVTLEIYAEGNKQVCGIHQIEGQLRLPPKSWLKAMRDELTKIEDIARDAGCAEMRVAGRDWSRILTDYEPLPGVPNGLRKVL